ncbi:pyrophosphate-energized vacuolar membrane proton pump [Tanacetum coccineum]|uniref:H(+)-exporting diphosphatase n=1 Tax=Tanacetum coccineum TaxID=301880 RepID=A0ABQ5EDT3_9ASTR
MLHLRVYGSQKDLGLFEAITGYGLGGSSMALFCRVGGGIYTNAADVGADIVGKVERNILEDDPRNPAIMSGIMLVTLLVWDLIFSVRMLSLLVLHLLLLSSLCLGSTTSLLLCVIPVLVSSVGIIVCLITTLFAIDFFKIKAVKDIEPALKNRLIISIVLMIVGVAINIVIELKERKLKGYLYARNFSCVCVGLWVGLIIGFVTEYYTNNAYRTGAATNVIFGLALGYKSVIIPIFAIAVSIFVSFTFTAMYGVAVAALGMLSTIATGLAIDAYSPIGDNDGGIAEMAGSRNTSLHRIKHEIGTRKEKEMQVFCFLIHPAYKFTSPGTLSLQECISEYQGITHDTSENAVSSKPESFGYQSPMLMVPFRGSWLVAMNGFVRVLA